MEDLSVSGLGDEARLKSKILKNSSTKKIRNFIGRPAIIEQEEKTHMRINSNGPSGLRLVFVMILSACGRDPLPAPPVGGDAGSCEPLSSDIVCDGVAKKFGALTSRTCLPLVKSSGGLCSVACLNEGGFRPRLWCYSLVIDTVTKAGTPNDVRYASDDDCSGAQGVACLFGL